MLFRPNDADVVEQARALLARLDTAQQAQPDKPPIASA
jgi:tRNA 2-selenouridine synthase